MLTEAAPYNFTENNPTDARPITLQSPVQLINQAWSKFIEDPENYTGWEKKAVADYVSN
jgi:hypothetical protein